MPKRTGSNPSHSLRGDWASTWGNGSQMGGVSDRRAPLGGLPLAHKFPLKVHVVLKISSYCRNAGTEHYLGA